MEKLEQLTDSESFSKEISIYVPSTDNLNEPITEGEFKDRIKETQMAMTKHFGGTTMHGIGTYLSEGGSYVKEDVAVVDVKMTYEKWLKHKDDVYAWLRKKSKEWGQEAIAFEYGAEMQFIS